MKQVNTLLLSILLLSISSMTLANLGYTPEELRRLAELEKRSQPSTQTQALIQNKTQASREFQQQALEQARAWQSKLNTNDLQRAITIPEATPNPATAPTGVMVFVSLTMPESSLRSLLKQSEIWQVPLVIRGVLPQGFPATANKIQSLLTEPNGNTIQSGIAINPEWFRTFDIKEVPTFVAVKPGRCLPKQPCHHQDYDIIRGNVSLPDALEHLARGDNPEVVLPILQRQQQE
ncbi:type-F conjugative transfer system pilin assembly protein TrbC [Vibrio mediterranei]|uniref:type-F conjugative transfer system pilin assembly protein TrbC n=1 Tax=Vibrio mediterranei TaxID=689 RepID=UPI0040687439